MVSDVLHALEDPDATLAWAVNRVDALQTSFGCYCIGDAAFGGWEHSEFLARGAHADCEGAPVSVIAVELLRRGDDVWIGRLSGSRNKAHCVVKRVARCAVGGSCMSKQGGGRAQKGAAHGGDGRQQGNGRQKVSRLVTHPVLEVV